MTDGGVYALVDLVVFGSGVLSVVELNYFGRNSTNHALKPY